MGTKNPKISAYVPQEVFDRFQSFQVERGFSMSKAVIAIFSDYFGMKKTTNSLPGGITVAQFEALAKKMTELEQKFDSLPVYQKALLISAEPQELGGSVETPQLPPQVEPEEDYSDTPPIPFTYAKDEPQKDTSEPLTKDEVVQLNISEVMSGKDLAVRLSILQSKLSGMKGKMNQAEFIEWSKGLDPDGISWTYRNKIKGKGVEYFPAQ